MSDGKRGQRGGSAPARLSTLLSAVLELPPDERERWIDESSGGNLGLRAQLREMLRTAQADAGHHHGDETQLLDPSDSPHPSTGAAGRGSSADEPGGDRLALGQQLGRYQVLDLLGAGGMGRVYRALDATLDREVAIKGLADAFRGDSRSLRRFEREARVLAALSHPNIAAIYGLERLNGSPYLVLERVDGETLAQRLVRGAVPIDEALALAGQIIAGLEEAHAKGVIHRDLKPSNVMLTPGRQVKLVDFGLAKTAAVRADLEESVEPITEVGLVVGTARYMSPEQVTGGEVDTRTDVWAFGCVLFEMLAARPAFAGRSVSEVAAAVLRDEPDWTALPAAVPRGVVRLIRRCLRRDPRARLQHIGDARVELSDLDQDTDRSGLVAARSGPGRPLWWTLAAATLVAAVGGALFLLRPQEPAAAPAVRLSLELPAPVVLASEFSAPFALSPAGSLLAVEALEGGLRRLYVRELRDPALRRLAGTEGARQPFFSPDGRWVGFFTERKVAKVPVDGGPVLELADVGGNHRGATWAADGSIVIAASQTAGLLRLPARGGRPEPLTTLDLSRDEYLHRWPDALPGTPWVLFTVGFEDATFDEGRIDAVSLETGERRQLVAGAGFARYLPGRGLLFVRGGRVYTVAFDPDRIAVVGTPDVLLDAVRYDWRNGGSHLAVSTSGVLVYTPGEPVSHEYYLSWVGHDGRFTRAVDTPRRFRDSGGAPTAAASRSRWARRRSPTSGRSTPTGRCRGSRSACPRSARRGRRTAAASPSARGKTAGGGCCRCPPTAPASLACCSRVATGCTRTPGRRMAGTSSSRSTARQRGGILRTLAVDHAGQPAGTPTAFASSPFHEMNAAISPDGRWVAYESDELDGVVQIYVRAWPDGTGKVLASTGGARWPAWGLGGELYYWQTGENMLRVTRTREQGGQLTIGPAEPMWTGEVATEVLRRVVITTPNARFDNDPRAPRFLVLEKAQAGTGPDLRAPVVVLGTERDRRPGTSGR